MPVESPSTPYGCHGIEIDPSNRYVFVPHVARSGGPNAVAQLRFDERSGRLTRNTPAFLSLKDNEGPRHLLVHPTLNLAYSADEQGCSATAYRLDPSTGTLTKLQSISTGTQRLHGEESGHLFRTAHPSQREAAVRRHPRAQQHRQLRHRPDDGQAERSRPRADRAGREAACLDPSGRFMTAAGSGGTAGRLVTHEVSSATGKMTPLETYDAGNGPMWILMMRGPGSARG